MSWLNFNDSLNSIKGQLSNFANTVLADENLGDENNGETLGESNIVRDNKNDAFEKGDSWTWSTDESKTDQLKTDETITNLKRKILELENENRDLIASLDKLELNHEENNAELIKIKNKLKEELETVTEKYEVLNMRYNKLALAENGYKKRLNELKNKFDGTRDEEEKRNLEEKIATLEATNEELKNKLNDTNAVIDSKLMEMESNVNRLESENKALKISLQMFKNKETNVDYEVKIKTLEDELGKIKEENRDRIQETKGTKNEAVNEINIHRNYLNNLNDNFFEYFKIPLDEHQDSQTLEATFNDALKNIANLLKTYETKNALMESRIFELTQSRTDIQNEKNEEIERLLQNSEMLTQELLRKSTEIKDLEKECAQLMKNNDLLIGKLTDTKENTLQTIFESNEENVDTLEKEVECANQKIDELQHQLSECQAENENEKMKNRITDLESELKITRSERDNCRVLIDKMRLDFETTEYQFSEMNVNLETLSEEIEKHKRKIDALVVENNDLKSAKNAGEMERLVERSKGLERKIEEFQRKIHEELNEKEVRIENLEKMENSSKLLETVHSLRKQLQDVVESRDKLQESLNGKQKEIEDLIKFKDGLTECLANVENEVIFLTKRRDENLYLLENCRKDLKAMTSARDELQAALEDAQKKLQNGNDGDSEKLQVDLRSTLENAQKKQQDPKSVKDDKLDSSDKLQATLEDAQKQLKNVTESRDNLQASLEDAQKKIEDVVKAKNELQSNLEISQEELRAMTLSRDELLISLEETQKQLKDATSRNDWDLEFKELQVAFENAQKELERVTESRNDAQEKLNDEIASRNELQDRLEMLQEELQAVRVSRDELQGSLETTQKELQDYLESSQKELQMVMTSRSELQSSLEEAQKELQAVKIVRIELQNSLENSQKELQDVVKSRNGLQASLDMAQEKLQNMTVIKDELESSLEHTQKELELVMASRNESSLENAEENSELLKKLQETTASLAKTQKELQDVVTSRNELIAIVQTKHQETLTYHAEIQRLSEILRVETEKNIQLEKQIKTAKNDEEIEKLNDQISFLREKCNVMAQNILDEQRKNEDEKLTFFEKETTLNKNLERLQNHLMEVEEHYTQELLASEGKIASLQAKLNEVEQREKDSSTVYTSVSIRANQQNEALQQQLQSMKNQRDELKKKLMELEDENNVKTAALSNLQLVLEQFQKDKGDDVARETERIRRQLKQERKIQEDLRKEITTLETQIKENKQGLQAALRLADQLETSKSQISNLREEINVLNEKLAKKEEELKTIASQTDGKIDKSLIKNLIIGFIASNNKLNKDQSQILKIIATVLDFNEQEHNRVNLNQTQQSNWLKTVLSPIAGDDAPNYESLSRAFVNFLENESKPRVVPSLLPQQSEESGTSTSTSSTRTTPTPIVLNEIVLPTFSDFPQHRNSSSILKGVLKDNP